MIGTYSSIEYLGCDTRAKSSVYINLHIFTLGLHKRLGSKYMLNLAGSVRRRMKCSKKSKNISTFKYTKFASIQ